MADDKDVRFVVTGYGKDYVRVLYLKREGNVHSIKEIEVNTQLTLDSQKDYVHADNTGIIATDSQKNTVYILARRNGVETIEKFALELCQHFLAKYSHVTNVKVHIKEEPWKRVQQGDIAHLHTFVLSPEVGRFCDVEQARNGTPTVCAGIRDFKLMKTTQSAFTNFVADEFRSLPDMDDRVFCTVVQSRWWYNSLDNLDFNQAWESVKNSIIDMFAGPPEEGIFSASVQHTVYLSEKLALSRVPQISRIEMVLPNVHCYEFDFKKFPAFSFDENKQVFQPVDKPSGNIMAVIERNPKAKL